MKMTDGLWADIPSEFGIHKPIIGGIQKIARPKNGCIDK
jgi:hypothetical protein